MRTLGNIVPYHEEFNNDKRGKVIGAVLRSMQVVRQFQRGRCIDALGSKSDGTLSALTADKASEAAGKKILLTIPGVLVHGEETGPEGPTSDIIVCLDALDGSMPFAVGAGTSTVIAATYSRSCKEVFFCVVGNPQTGQIWVGQKGVGTMVMAYSEDGSEPTPDDMSVCSVSSEPISSKTRVFTDCYPGFKRDGREILTRSELNRLEGLIDEKAGKLMLGSNGIHHALVAHGGKGAVGAVTTAIGGYWDVCPVLLVLQAGGCAAAFRVEAKGTLTECNPLSVMDYDILVTANNQETLDVLVRAVRASKGQ